MANIDFILAGHFDAYYIAFAGTGSDPVTDNAVDWTGWTQFGYQNPDGATLLYTPEFLEAFVSDTHAIVKENLIKEEAMLSFTLLESDLAAIGLSSAPGTYADGVIPGTNPNTSTWGDKTNANLAFYSIGLEGVGSTGLAEVWVIYKAMAMGPLDATMTKFAWRGVPYAWRVHSVPTRTAADRMFKAYEITSA